jgi:hypothetical protein
VPPESALQWPLDLFEDRADLARRQEALQLGDSKSQKFAAVAEAGEREKARRRAAAVGLPALFIHD